jgi:hypothetical protein
MYLVKSCTPVLTGCIVFASLVACAPTTSSPKAVSTTTCNGKTYIYEEMAGYGFLPSNARDKKGDTLGGIGSSIAIDRSSWKKTGNSYTGLLYALPDRGWNTQGTLRYENRVHKIQINFTPNETATVDNPSGPNLNLKYLDSILFTDPKGAYTCGLDADAKGPYLKFKGIPFQVPSVHYEGNGFGQNGPGGTCVSFDSEGIFLGHDGTFWVSDEYGPYVYHFDQSGKMIGAIQPPSAILPRRNGSISFSADSPPIYDPTLDPIPADNPTGRNNNQGFEGLTTNPQGTRLYVLLQSAANQEGGLGDEDSSRSHSRFLIYDITKSQPEYLAEYVVTLPLVDPSDTTGDIAAQSEIHYISDTQFMVLARDSGHGAGQDKTKSKYRHVDVFDISKATNVKGNKYDCSTCAIASENGDLKSSIQAAEYCSWLDFNDNDQLERFGVHNGGDQDSGLLNEKWESLAVLPATPKPGQTSDPNNEYYLFSLSDNDFITQDGYMNFGKYKYSDDSGFNL